MKREVARFIQEGKSLNYKNATDEAVSFGDLVKLTERYGIAAANIPVGSVGVVTVSGVFEVPADTAAFTMGQSLGWDEANKKAVAFTEGQVKLGWAAVDKAAGVGFACVKIGG